MNELNKLLDVIKTLRGENGCSWDKAQTIETLTGSIIEESYELVDSIETGNIEDIKEELGDLIFLSLFVAYIGAQENRFTIEEVVEGVTEKLIRRHPHVFGEIETGDVKEILKNWEKIKAGENKNKKRKSIIDGIPKKLPEIYRFFKILDKLTRNDVSVDEIDTDRLKNSLNHFLDKGDETFIKDFLIYCYRKKIDLPNLIRKSEKFLLKN
ncbi:MAG: MazG family protein [Brevinematales bacterium]|nr:MazG family protein [Brevinematales bacterium]